MQEEEQKNRRNKNINTKKTGREHYAKLSTFFF